MKKEYKLQIKTPLWTGDIDTNSNVLQPTGIIGSLRWWLEAVIRGMDKSACDPAGDDRCPRQVTKNNQKVIQYCSACLIFGATGIRRMFRLEMNGGVKLFDGGAINIKPNSRNRGWYLGSGLIGQIDLHVIPLDRDFDENLILIPLVIATNWGGIGVKTQHGYGVVEIENKMELKFEDFESVLKRIFKKDRIKNLNIEERMGTNKILPNLKEMFFARVQFEAKNDWWRDVDGIKQTLEPKDKNGNIIKDLQQKNKQILTSWFETNSVPIVPSIKNWLRYRNGSVLWKTNDRNQNKKIENWLFGTIKNGKESSKINISSAYKVDAYKVNNNLWEFRIWGWIPKSYNPEGFNRENFLNNLKNALNGSGKFKMPWNELLDNKTNQTQNHKLIVWREFESPRDTIKPNETSIENFIQSLLKNDGGYQ